MTDPTRTKTAAECLQRIRDLGYPLTYRENVHDGGRAAHATGFRVWDALFLTCDPLEQTQASADLADWLAGFWMAHAEAQKEAELDADG